MTRETHIPAKIKSRNICVVRVKSELSLNKVLRFLPALAFNKTASRRPRSAPSAAVVAVLPPP
jgi:hypothetical protein